MEYQERYSEWMTYAGLDADTKRELADIAGDAQEIEERFYRELEFGTAGLRGVIGAGTNRMNVYVVRRATQGLAAYLSGVEGAKARGVCIAYDSRRFSQAFAEETAGVLAANGVKTYLFSTLHSVPQLSFTLQRLGCMAGVVITASHNPKEYNGYKVYWAYGGQVAPSQAADIYAEIRRIPMFGAQVMPLTEAKAAGLVTMIGEAEDEAYYAATEKLLLAPDVVRAYGPQLKLVYTPLHGTGCIPVKALLNRIGVTNVSVVPAQAAPDGAFPTVSAPNPEDPNAFRLAIQLAEETGATVCLATDPDADRLGIAVRTAQGAWMTLTGNQIGAILLEHILSERAAAGTLPENGVVVKSIVSTMLADAIAARYGVEMVNVMTGFRFIGEKIDEYSRTGAKTFLFGFEESFGFLAGGLARDKDAISAAMLAAEACCVCLQKGITLADRLESIYETYGCYQEKVKSYTLVGKVGMEKIAACMERLRGEPMAIVAGVPVAAHEDYVTRRRTDGAGAETALALPKANMVRLVLADGTWIVVRPSGTEPKLKLYIGAKAADRAGVEALLTRVFTEIDAHILSLLG